MAIKSTTTRKRGTTWSCTAAHTRGVVFAAAWHDREQSRVLSSSDLAYNVHNDRLHPPYMDRLEKLCMLALVSNWVSSVPRNRLVNRGEKINYVNTKKTSCNTRLCPGQRALTNLYSRPTALEAAAGVVHEPRLLLCRHPFRLNRNTNPSETARV